MEQYYLIVKKSNICKFKIVGLMYFEESSHPCMYETNYYK